MLAVYYTLLTVSMRDAIFVAKKTNAGEQL